MSDHSYRPKAREDGLLVEPMDEELLVFDSERNRAHSLNQTAARVWRACDGERDISALQVACGLDEETLQLALERLRTSRLLDEADGPPPVSRRLMLRKSVIAGAGIGVALPIIRSINAPTAQAAGSCKALGVSCSRPSSCCNGRCSSGPNSVRPHCCVDTDASGCTTTSDCCNSSTNVVCNGGRCEVPV